MNVIHSLCELLEAGANRRSLPSGKGALDICGTGGDGFNLFNVSTAAAIVCCAAGANVIKHSGGASSSKSGSTEVLYCLGYNRTDKAYHEFATEFISLYRQEGFLSLKASEHNSLLRGAAEARSSIRKPTIFNSLAPFVNPANPSFRVIGLNAESRAISEELLSTIIHRVDKVWLLSAFDGLDEISTVTPTRVDIGGLFKLRETFTIDPRNYGYNFSDHRELVVNGPRESANIIRNVFAHRATEQQVAAVVLNAAAGLTVAGIAPDYAKGVDIAKFVISGDLAERKVNAIGGW